jgi:hypothetical protein
MEANQEKTKAKLEEVLAKVDAYLEETEACLKEMKDAKEVPLEKTEACLEKKEPIPEEMAQPEEFNEATRKERIGQL